MSMRTTAISALPGDGLLVPAMGGTPTGPFWTDPGFWLVFFGNIAAVATLVFHKDFGQWVQALAPMAAMLGNTVYAFSKHRQQVAVNGQVVNAQMHLRQMKQDQAQAQLDRELESRRIGLQEKTLAHEEKVFAASQTKTSRAASRARKTTNVAFNK